MHRDGTKLRQLALGKTDRDPLPSPRGFITVRFPAAKGACAELDALPLWYCSTSLPETFGQANDLIEARFTDGLRSKFHFKNIAGTRIGLNVVTVPLVPHVAAV
jgi:hypothetical protein